MDRNFLRNLQGYLADCHRENIEPSKFQLALLVYHASSLLTPPFWVPLSLLKFANHVVACWIGQYLLG